MGTTVTKLPLSLLLSRSLSTGDEGIANEGEEERVTDVGGNEGGELLGVDPEGKFVSLCLVYICAFILCRALECLSSPASQSHFVHDNFIFPFKGIWLGVLSND